jgi:hypothetical protein
MKIMKFQKLLLTSALATLVVSGSGLIQAAGELYRYEGADGEVVIDDHIPPEFVHKGYSILSANGMVIETIERELTDEERAAMSEELRLKRELEEEKRKQKKRDEWLLKRFSDAGDAVLARDRQLGTLDTLIIVAQSNIKKLKKDEAKELSYAARAEREGKGVPDDVIKNLESIRNQIRAAELQIEKQKDEQNKIKEKYQAMIERMEEIEKEREKEDEGEQAGF